MRDHDEDEGECRDALLDVLILLRIWRSKDSAQDQCDQAYAERQSKLPRDLGACHPPELPQHRGRGRTQLHHASTGSRSRPARARKTSSSVASRDSTTSPPSASTA